MQLIVKKTTIKTEYEHFELAFYLTGDEKAGYGIRIVEYSHERIRTACHVDNISRSGSEILELIELYATAELCPVHLPDAVMDHYERKRLRILAEIEPAPA